MTATQALKRLLQLGAGNPVEITDAIMAVGVSPIADKRALRAIRNAIPDLTSDQAAEFADVIAELSGAETRGVLPRGDEPASTTVQGRVTPDRKRHWNNFARQNDLTLWRLIEDSVDERTGYREE